jgi:primosomal protein N'
MLDTSKDCTKCYDGYFLKNVPSGVMCAVCNSADSGIEKCKDCKSTGTGETAVTTCNACMDPVNMKNAKNYYLTSDK